MWLHAGYHLSIIWLCMTGAARVIITLNSSPSGTISQVTVTKTDQNTLANGWSVGMDIKAGDIKTVGAEVTTKFAYNGMYTAQHVDTKVQRNDLE